MDRVVRDGDAPVVGWPGGRNPAFFSATDLDSMLLRLNGRYYKKDDAVLPVGNGYDSIFECDKWNAFLSRSGRYVGTTTDSFHFNPLGVISFHRGHVMGIIHNLVWFPERIDVLAECDLPALVDGLRNRGSFTIGGAVDEEHIRNNGAETLVYEDDTILTMLAAEGQIAGIQVLVRHLGALPDELLDAPGYRGMSAVHWASTYDDVRELFNAQKRIPNDIRRKMVRNRVRTHPATRKRLQTDAAVAFLCAARAQHALADDVARAAVIDMRSVPDDVVRRVVQFAFWIACPG